MDFKYFLPTTVDVGLGLSNSVGEMYRKEQVDKVFIITDRGIRKAGILEGILNSLEENVISVDIYDEVIPNPNAESIMNGVEKLKSSGATQVLAVGGGSSIDTAKGVAIMMQNEGNILDYEGVGLIKHPGVDLTVIPTTAGTGSEVTASTIVTDAKTQFKAAVISPYLFPKKTILDAELIVGLPQEITAATGMDALTHAIESYTSKTANPISQALAIQAIKMISAHIKNTYFVGNNLESRENMLIASLLAGAAFSQSRLGNVHAISHTFGGVFDIPHGIANATLLPFVMEFNLPACPEKMADIAEAMGEDTIGLSSYDAGKKAIEAVIKLNQSLQIPNNIKDIGVNLDYLSKLVEDSMRSGNVLINPRLTKANDIEQIIKNAYNGELHV
ncbi:iron-containing alcohol dehydrogenase [Gracilibacillus kekensis]|uniref:1,3-propanediol dehydrogenase n=1 Tax=Gracilibacillus kekensis TaxID=1027249 RepID=A0A1M7Q8C8_9BACI|nr:iron-containing alcohol dehydrogenase [Gracilibacillus kekensis]SHN26845.1 1,3-propanediol dehydrogenase [Gracilibacillus kekensis]